MTSTLNTFSKLLFLLFAALLFNSSSQLLVNDAHAELCAADPVPGATLLYPYFEVDIPNKCKKSKFSQKISITNVSAGTQYTRVVLWTDFSVPIYGFNLRLDGYESISFDLLELLCKGNGVGNDFNGDPNEALNSDELSIVKAAFTGKPLPSNSQCASHQRSGSKAVGYITVDNSGGNISGFPTDGTSYTDNLSFENNLVGDYYIIDKRTPGAKRVCGSDKKCARKYKAKILSTRGIRGAKAVSLEADETAFNPGDHTFYGRYVGGSAADGREPLPTTWHVRYQKSKNRKKFDLIVWREGNSSFSSFDCDSEPDFHPMNMTQLVAFSEGADALEFSSSSTPLGPLAFHDETQALSNSLANVPFSDGWLYFNFNTTFSENNAYSGPTGSSWVITRRDGIIDESGAHPMTSGCD